MAESRKTMSAAEVQEEWLEIQAAQRNAANFQPLYERYYEPVYRFVYRRTVDGDLTADLCSQVFLKVLQRISSYENRGVPFSAWLFRIASNEVAQHFRSRKTQRTISIDEGQLHEMREPDEEDADAWQAEDLVEALDQLRESDLLIIEMRYFEQRPFKEIADILGISQSNAKMKTYRILERMKRNMQPNRI